MSDLAVCRLAYDGSYTAVVNAVESDNSMLTKLDNAGRNPLHWAACGGHLELVKFLISKGLDKDSKDQAGWTPLMIAVSAGRQDVAEYLIESADVNVINSTGQCCLHYAASKNRIKLIHKLLEAGAKPDICDWSGTTPLHRAIALNNLEIARILLDFTSNDEDDAGRKQSSLVNLSDKAGQTPLHYACEEENMQAVQLLVSYGASQSVLDKNEKTPVEVAPDNFRMQLQKFFKSTERVQDS